MGKRRESQGRHEGRLAILYWEGAVLFDTWWNAQRSLPPQYVKHFIVSDSDFRDEGQYLLDDLSRNPYVSKQRPDVQQGNVSGSATKIASDPF